MSDYNAGNIVVLEGLDAVRKRPGMYIGTTGSKGLHHILWEIIDNGIDELVNGYGDTVTVELLDDNKARVTDNGRGIPVDKHPTLGVSGVEVVFTTLHAGGKFGGGNYAFSGGLHGVGASVTNALSTSLVVEIAKDGNSYIQEFHSPMIGGVIKSGVPLYALRHVGKTNKTGTTVTFKPDERVFKDAKFNYETVASRLREIAFLNKGITLSIKDRRIALAGGTGKEEVFCYKGGVSDFVEYLNDGRDNLYETPLYVEHIEKDFELFCAIQHTDSYTENILSYVNSIPTSEGGTHEVGFKSAVTKVFNDFAKNNNVVKDKKDLPMGEDYREGMTAVLSIKVKEPQFEGQTKSKLGNPEVRPQVESAVVEKLEALVGMKALKKSVEKIIAKALNAAKSRTAAKKARELTRRQNSLMGANLIGKLSSCSGKRAEINELFIVEGDSAGGSAKQARNRAFQAILPLRGKPLNAEKKRLDEVLNNEEFCTIISALGAGVDREFKVENLKFHKVIILADADQDGGHIRAILLTFFFRYMRPLIAEGHLYIGMPPLYKIQNKKETRYCYDDEELSKIRSEMGKGATLQRFKGLGEMNPEQLWDTTMNPDTRSLVRVTLDDLAAAEKSVFTLLGENVEIRKRYIFENCDFNREDNFKADTSKKAAMSAVVKEIIGNKAEEDAI